MKKNIIINLIDKLLDFENELVDKIDFYDYLYNHFLLNDFTNIFMEYNLILEN
jgi:hypothetical protein